MMAWGLDGSAWDDAGDWAYLTYNDFDTNAKPEWHMMTTCHDDEKLSEVYQFSLSWTGSHVDVEMEHTLVLHVAGQRDEGRIMGLLLAPLED
jgi:hypothetical protein